MDDFEDKEGEKEEDDWDGEQAAAEVRQFMSVLIGQIGFSFEDVQLRYDLRPHLITAYILSLRIDSIRSVMQIISNYFNMRCINLAFNVK